MQGNPIADAFDALAGDFKTISRDATVGATEGHIAGSIARTLMLRAAKIRSTSQEEADAAERRQAAEAAAAPAPAEPAAAGLTDYDPAEHSVNEVNDHLRDATPGERARVLDLEKQDRPDVPETKKQRTGILSGPHGEF